jgi:hypothetical protein
MLLVLWHGFSTQAGIGIHTTRYLRNFGLHLCSSSFCVCTKTKVHTHTLLHYENCYHHFWNYLITAFSQLLNWYSHLLAVCYWLLCDIWRVNFWRKIYINQKVTHLLLSFICDLYQSAHKIWITVTGYLTSIATFFVIYDACVRAYVQFIFIVRCARVNGFLSTLKDKVKHKSACRTRCKKSALKLLFIIDYGPHAAYNKKREIFMTNAHSIHERPRETVY